MTDEKLERANNLKWCLEVLNTLKDIFESDTQISVNQNGTTGLTDDILSGWKEMNAEYLGDCIKDVEKEFKKL